jgi:GTP-binding protein Era
MVNVFHVVMIKSSVWKKIKTCYFHTLQEIYTPAACLEQPINPHRLSVAIIGPANAGKSTLLNRLLGKKLAIVSRQPQSTRDRLLAIVTDQTTTKNTQLLMYDTPGFLNMIKNKRRMVPKTVHIAPWDALEQCDKILWMMDVHQLSKYEIEKNSLYITRLKEDYEKKPVIFVINKSDYLEEDERKQWIIRLPNIEKQIGDMLTERHMIEKSFLISALNGWNVNDLKHYLTESAVPNDWVYASNVITDQHPIQLAQEALRQQLFSHVFQEIPYMCRIKLIAFDDTTDHDTLSLILEIHVGSESQRQIILGKGARLLHKMEYAAAKELCQQSGKHVNLHVTVKVKKTS